MVFCLKTIYLLLPKCSVCYLCGAFCSFGSLKKKKRKKSNQYACLLCASLGIFLLDYEHSLRELVSAVNWRFQQFRADRRWPYLLKTLTYCLLFDSTNSRPGIPACSCVIPRRFITLSPLKPYSQLDVARHTRICLIFRIVHLFPMFTGCSDFPVFACHSVLQHAASNTKRFTLNLNWHGMACVVVICKRLMMFSCTNRLFFFFFSIQQRSAVFCLGDGVA